MMRKLAAVMLFLLLLALILLVWPLFREEQQNVQVRSDTFLTVFGNRWEDKDSHGTIEGILENFMTENPRIAVLYEGMKAFFLQMPVMDGLESARRIRALDRADLETIPIAALTANTFTEESRIVKQAGMNHSLAKPADTAAFFLCISR